MIIHTEQNTESEPPSIRLYSDAPTEAEAVRDIRSWATLNRSAPYREPHLQKSTYGGSEVYVGRAYDTVTVVDYGQQIYDAIGEELEKEHTGRIVAIDILSHDYCVANNERLAGDELRAKHPDAIVYLAKIGYNAFGGIGASVTRIHRS